MFSRPFRQSHRDENLFSTRRENFLNAKRKLSQHEEKIFCEEKCRIIALFLVLHGSSFCFLSPEEKNILTTKKKKTHYKYNVCKLFVKFVGEKHKTYIFIIFTDMKKYNFSAGPSILPQEVMKATAEACKDFNGIGLSLMEMSHRSKDWQAVMDETDALFKEVLQIPAGYSVVLLGGGASMQFCMVPYNLLEKKAAYLNTGVWAKKALKEAKLFGEVVEVASSADANYTFIPKDYVVPADADYFHITTNNTIYGTEIRKDLDSPVPLVADMSSDIFSRPVDVSKYGMIYGGAQKNLAMAGVTFVIVKDELLGKVSRTIPTMLDYRTHIDKGSMFNTPPVVPIYSAYQTLKWIKASGGTEEMERRALRRADLLYGEIDRNRLFVGTANEEDRSLMNICFVLKDEYKELEKDFFDFATARGMVGIKGHRSVGGFRASCYNAMTVEGVQALVDAMRDFEKEH